MRNLKFLPAIIGATLVILIILYVAFHYIFLDLFVDLWWYQSLKLEAYFWLRLLYKFFLSGGVTLVFFAIFFFFSKSVRTENMKRWVWGAPAPCQVPAP